MSGFTSSSAGFPLMNPARPANGGGTQDAFVTVLETDLPIVPTTYHVNSNADPGDGVCDQTCTLRDAILASTYSGRGTRSPSTSASRADDDRSRVRTARLD